MLRTHWGVEDPVRATGSDAGINAAYMTAYRSLRARIEAFFALPLSKDEPVGVARLRDLAEPGATQA